MSEGTLLASSAVPTLSEFEREILGYALSNYVDVRPHLGGEHIELVLNLAEKLEIRPDLLSKVLQRVLKVRSTQTKAGATT